MDPQSHVCHKIGDITAGQRDLSNLTDKRYRFAERNRKTIGFKQVLIVGF